MITKETVTALIERIKTELKMPSQEAVALGAGYEKKTLTQTISKGRKLEAIHTRLMLIYGDRLAKSTNGDSKPRDPLDILARSFEVLAETHKEVVSTNSRLARMLESNLIGTGSTSSFEEKPKKQGPGHEEHIPLFEDTDEKGFVVTKANKRGKSAVKGKQHN